MQANELLQNPDLGISEDNLYQLLQTKNQLNRLQTFTSELYNAISNLLESDEDMAQMYLTQKKVNQRPRMVMEHEEIEMLLETYYSSLEDSLNRIKETNHAIKSTQDFLNISLDSIRNRMMQVDLRLSIGSFSIALGTFIVGAFGMNLLSHLEQNPIMCINHSTPSPTC